jgi:peptidoglycan/xylan/chitin deacetylase (PgdA/CDA1 family)
VIRPQSILVLVLLVAVILWGAQSVGSGMQSGEPGHSPADTNIAPSTMTPSTIVPTTRPMREPSPTPRPTDTPEPEPTATEEPAATERPPAPDTGLDGASLIVERGSSDRLEVAFTFDAGEGAGHTEEILDLLEEYGVRGTFGITGEWVEDNPELAQRIVDEGHMVINHTYDHQSFTGESTGAEPLTDEERTLQVERTEQIIRDVTGYETAPYFRFPYGAYDQAALDLLADLGYDYTVWWSCDTQGWNGKRGEEIVELCGPDAEKGGPGAIILMHVADDNDFDALPLLLDDYLSEGYDLVTIEEMLQP